jgi:hypothetical protein
MNRGRELHEIAAEIDQDWPQPFYGAVPYLAAMRRMGPVTGMFGEDDGKSVVLYFLSNAKTWRGDLARRVKAELKSLIK